MAAIDRNILQPKGFINQPFFHCCQMMEQYFILRMITNEQVHALAHFKKCANIMQVMVAGLDITLAEVCFRFLSF